MELPRQYRGNRILELLREFGIAGLREILQLRVVDIVRGLDTRSVPHVRPHILLDSRNISRCKQVLAFTEEGFQEGPNEVFIADNAPELGNQHLRVEPEAPVVHIPANELAVGGEEILVITREHVNRLHVRPVR